MGRWLRGRVIVAADRFISWTDHNLGEHQRSHLYDRRKGGRHHAVWMIGNATSDAYQLP